MKKKLIKEGLLDAKGKPNEKTPQNWFTLYKEYSHAGDTIIGAETSTPASVPIKFEQTSPNGEEDIPADGDGEAGEKKKKKKKKKKKEQDSDNE